MAIDYRKALALDIPVVEQTFTERDTMLYALGLGLGSDPLNEAELRYVYEKALRTFPTMPVSQAFVSLRAIDLGIDYTKMVHGEQSLRLHAQILSAVPEDIRPAPDEEGLHDFYARGVMPEWAAWQAPLRKFLAAKAFANWTAYQGRGVLAIVRGLEAALAFVRVESARECRNAGRALDGDLLKQAFRAADFVLNHIAVGDDLATAWSDVEGQASKTATTGP